MDLLQIAPERIIKPAAGTNFLVKNLYVTEVLNDPEQFYDKQKLIAQMREMLLSKIDDKTDGADYPKRIYVQRINLRKPDNEKQVIELLKQYGFEVIVPENLSVKEQIKHFHNADIVVTPHGANSTNALYMRPKTHFIEAFSCVYNNPCMLPAVKLLNLRYTNLAERSGTPEHIKNLVVRNWEGSFCYTNMNVNLNFLDAVLAGVL